MASGKRFEIIIEDRTTGKNTRVLKDKETGVLYIYHGSDRGGGITPLLGPDGKPIIEPVEK